MFIRPHTLTEPRFTTLLLLTGCAMLSLNMFLPSLANIAVDLQADYATVSLAVAVYLAAVAVIQLIAGPLSDRIGRRSVILAALVLFTTASTICALATNVWVFLVFRMLQGGIVTGYALSLAILRDTKSEASAARFIGYLSMAVATAPMIGPLMGGFLDAAFGWRASFVFYALVGFGLLVLCWFDLGETRRAAPAPGQRITIGVPAPLKIPTFWLYSLCGTFSTSAFYIFIAGAPLVAQVQFGITTAELGAYIASITVGFFIGTFLSTQLAERVRPGALILTGRTVACLGLLPGLWMASQGEVTPLWFFGSTIFAGFGNGLTMPNATAAALFVAPDHAGTAAGLNGALIVAVGAVVTTITGFALPDIDPALTLLILMLIACAIGLILGVLAVQRSVGVARD